MIKISRECLEAAGVDQENLDKIKDRQCRVFLRQDGSLLIDEGAPKIDYKSLYPHDYEEAQKDQAYGKSVTVEVAEDGTHKITIKLEAEVNLPRDVYDWESKRMSVREMARHVADMIAERCELDVWDLRTIWAAEIEDQMSGKQEPAEPAGSAAPVESESSASPAAPA